MKNFKITMIATTTICGAALLAGCPKQEETIVVQPPDKVIEKTTIKAAPPRKTVVVKQPQKAAPKTTVKTDVKVIVAPTPTAQPDATPTPAPLIKPAGTPRATPTPKPKVTPRATPKATTRPKPTVKPTTTPRPIAKADSKNLVVRAEVISTSKVPDPKTVPYKESLVFTKYKVLSVQSGQYKEKEILVAQWGMKDKKILPAARIRVGQVQTLSLEPLSNDLESVMRNDDTGEYELKPYFAK